MERPRHGSLRKAITPPNSFVLSLGSCINMVPAAEGPKHVSLWQRSGAALSFSKPLLNGGYSHPCLKHASILLHLHRSHHTRSLVLKRSQHGSVYLCALFNVFSLPPSQPHFLFPSCFSFLLLPACPPSMGRCSPCPLLYFLLSSFLSTSSFYQ